MQAFTFASTHYDFDVNVDVGHWFCNMVCGGQEEMAYVWHAFGERQPVTLRPGALKGVEEGLDPVSVVVHYLLKQLPAAYVGNNALDLSRMIKSSYDISLPQVRPHHTEVLFCM